MAPFNLSAQFSPFSSSLDERQGVSVISSNSVQPSVVVSGSSEGGICLVDLEKSLSILRCNGHQRAITDISFLASDPSLIITSSRDGSVSVFDSRLPADVNRVSRIRLSLDPDEADVWSVDAGGSSERLLACTVDNEIRMYDLRVVAEASYPEKRNSRATGLVWHFKDSHSDLINSVRFHPVRRSLLVSGADDDLICIHDTDQCRKSNVNPSPAPQTTPSSDDNSDAEDDPTVIGGMNNESPPRIIRFVGPNQDVLCAISTTETVQAWHCPTLSTPVSKSFSDVVESYSTASTSSSPFTSPKNNNYSSEEFPVRRLIPPIESVRVAPQLSQGDAGGYLVDAIYDDSTERLFVLGGQKFK